MGPNFTLTRDVFLSILATNLVHVFSSPSASFLTAIGENKELVKSEAANAVLNICLSIALAIQFGLIGVALGTFISATITSGWYIPFIASKKVQVPFSDFLRRTLLFPILYTLLIFIGLQTYFNDRNHDLTLVQILISSLWLLVLGAGGLLLFHLYEKKK